MKMLSGFPFVVLFFIILLLNNSEGSYVHKLNLENHAPKHIDHKVSSGTQKKSTAIVAGRSVGDLKLGDTYEEAIQLLGNPNEENRYGFDPPCAACQDCKTGFTDIRWDDREYDQNGITIYFNLGKIIQIDVQTRRYATASGVTVDNSPAVMRKQYPKMQAFELLNSNSPLVGGRNLVYWDDVGSGIAFELYYNRRLRKRLISKVIVHRPGYSVIPNDCSSDTRRLEPFTMEP